MSINILSLGAGVQSSTMALMAAVGEITPMPTAAIFADTMDEPEKVYTHLDWLEKQLPYSTHRVCKGDLMADSLKVVLSKKSGKLYMKGKIPAFVLKPDGKIGLLGRKCTLDFKIEPILKKTKEIIGKATYLEWRRKHKSALAALSEAQGLKLPPPHWAFEECQADALAVMQIGISTDEHMRAKPSRRPWIRNEWPLLDEGISRAQCITWLAKNGFPLPPRSACKKCPFHSDEEWASQTPEEFEESVAYEKAMQEAAASQNALIGIPFLHASCKPLETIQFAARSGYAQVDLFNNECEGMCGV